MAPVRVFLSLHGALLSYGQLSLPKFLHVKCQWRAGFPSQERKMRKPVTFCKGLVFLILPLVDTCFQFVPPAPAHCRGTQVIGCVHMSQACLGDDGWHAVPAPRVLPTSQGNRHVSRQPRARGCWDERVCLVSSETAEEEAPGVFRSHCPLCQQRKPSHRGLTLGPILDDLITEFRLLHLLQRGRNVLLG